MIRMLCWGMKAAVIVLLQKEEPETWLHISTLAAALNVDVESLQLQVALKELEEAGEILTMRQPDLFIYEARLATQAVELEPCA